MFENYANAKKRKSPRWAAPLMGASIGIYVAFFLFVWFKSVWQMEKLEVPKGSIEIGAAAPPPPPPPPPGGKKQDIKKVEIKKIKVTETVQPVKIEKQVDEPKPTETSDDPAGEEGGVEGGVAGGVVGGTLGGVVGGAAPPPPPPPPPAPPQNVPPTALEQSRIAGEKMIQPDEVTNTEIIRSGKSKLVGSFKLCLNALGNVSLVQMLKSTGFPAYDNKIQTEMHSWRYRPFMVNGAAAPVCTAVTFIYASAAK